jgi:dTDP-4-dehydrorhamnose 3,5-epimerase
MIDGVIITPLKQFCDDRGKVMKMLSRNDAIFREFGEIYFSAVHHDAVKGWSMHRQMTLNYAVPIGLIKLVLYDERKESPTQGKHMEVLLGPDYYCLVTIPPCIWYGFQGMDLGTSLVANCATLPHDPGEMERRDCSDPSVPYNW